MRKDSELAPKITMHARKNIFSGESGHIFVAGGGKVAEMAQDLNFLGKNNGFGTKELVRRLTKHLF